MDFLRCRSSNRQELEQEGPNRQKSEGSGRHRADKDEGSPFELTNVELEGQVRK